MFSESQHQHSGKDILKNPLFYSSILVATVLPVVLWILFSRWQKNLSIERRAREEKAEKQSESDRIVLEQLGGKELAIQSFYASPAPFTRKKACSSAMAWPMPKA
jgi:hypothetical protein